MIAVYPGSFDPITLGHVDIIQRLSNKFSELHILIAESSEKKSLFTFEERSKFIKEILVQNKNVFIHCSSGLTVDFAKKIKADCIVRGLRAVSDFEYEMGMANMNKKLAPEIETYILFASPQFNFVSSRLVKEIAKLGGDLNGLVPENVKEALKNKGY